MKKIYFLNLILCIFILSCNNDYNNPQYIDKIKVVDSEIQYLFIDDDGEYHFSTFINNKLSVYTDVNNYEYEIINDNVEKPIFRNTISYIGNNSTNKYNIVLPYNYKIEYRED